MLLVGITVGGGGGTRTRDRSSTNRKGWIRGTTCGLVGCGVLSSADREPKGEVQNEDERKELSSHTERWVRRGIQRAREVR